MSELRDLRAKISVETDAVLDSMSRATGCDRSEIVRGVLHRWALEQVTFATLCKKRLEVEGVSGNAGEG